MLYFYNCSRLLYIRTLNLIILRALYHLASVKEQVHEIRFVCTRMSWVCFVMQTENTVPHGPQLNSTEIAQLEQIYSYLERKIQHHKLLKCLGHRRKNFDNVQRHLQINNRPLHFLLDPNFISTSSSFLRPIIDCQEDRAFFNRILQSIFLQGTLQHFDMSHHFPRSYSHMVT